MDLLVVVAWNLNAWLQTDALDRLIVKQLLIFHLLNLILIYYLRVLKYM
jgi:hypothetical protein